MTVLLVAPASAVAYLGSLQLTGNFDAVVPGEIYRSAQLTPGQISGYIGAYSIKTIINLRGENRGRPWCDAEMKESDRLKVAHVDFGMSARHELSRAQAMALIALMETAEKPFFDPLQGRRRSNRARLGPLPCRRQEGRAESWGGAAVASLRPHFIALRSAIRDGADVRDARTRPENVSGARFSGGSRLGLKAALADWQASLRALNSGIRRGRLTLGLRCTTMRCDPLEHVVRFPADELQPFGAVHRLALARAPEFGHDEQFPAAPGAAFGAKIENVEVEAVGGRAVAVTLPPAVDASRAPFVAANVADGIVDEQFEVLNHPGARQSQHSGAP